ncbi:MAG: 6-carboxytetrahydropterin synthase [Gemmatimonadota bacterium]
MPIVRVTRRLHFSAAHRLHRPEWSDEQNQAVFGDCSNPQWHGHNYEIDVTVEGPVDPETGFVLDLKRLKRAVQDHVLTDVDHKNLNTEVSWLAGINPTTENVAVAMWHRIRDHLPGGVRLVRLKLWETPRNYVEYDGR